MGGEGLQGGCLREGLMGGAPERLGAAIVGRAWGREGREKLTS